MGDEGLKKCSLKTGTPHFLNFVFNICPEIFLFKKQFLRDELLQYKSVNKSLQFVIARFFF